MQVFTSFKNKGIKYFIQCLTDQCTPFTFMYSITGYKQGSLFQITNKRHVQQNIHTEIIQYRSASNKGVSIWTSLINVSSFLRIHTSAMLTSMKLKWASHISLRFSVLQFIVNSCSSICGFVLLRNQEKVMVYINVWYIYAGLC